MDFSTAIKKIVLNCIENEKISDLVYGTYLGSQLKIDNKPITIPPGMIDIPERLKKLSGEDALKSGDRVAVLQKHGGQRYFILDRL